MWSDPQFLQGWNVLENSVTFHHTSWDRNMYKYLVQLLAVSTEIGPYI